MPCSKNQHSTILHNSKGAGEPSFHQFLTQTNSKNCDQRRGLPTQQAGIIYSKTFREYSMFLSRQMKVVRGMDLGNPKSSALKPCGVCNVTKLRGRRFKKAINLEARPARLLERICIDMAVGLRSATKGCTNFIVIVDEASRFVYARALHRRSQAAAALADYIAWAESNV